MYTAYRCTPALQGHDTITKKLFLLWTSVKFRVGCWCSLRATSTPCPRDTRHTLPLQNAYRHTSSKRIDNNWIGQTSSSAGHLRTRDNNKPSRPQLLPLFLFSLYIAFPIFCLLKDRTSWLISQTLATRHCYYGDPRLQPASVCCCSLFLRFTTSPFHYASVAWGRGRHRFYFYRSLFFCLTQVTDRHY